MERQTRNAVFLVVGVAVAIANEAGADTLPPGATPLSGSVPVYLVGSDGIATLPIQTPEGQVFVLTDIEVGRIPSINIQIFGPEDPDNPRFQGRAIGNDTGYQRYFQTGLVFSAAPTIKLVRCAFGCDPEFTRVSFSGYFKAEP